MRLYARISVCLHILYHKTGNREHAWQVSVFSDMADEYVPFCSKFRGASFEASNHSSTSRDDSGNVFVWKSPFMANNSMQSGVSSY